MQTSKANALTLMELLVIIVVVAFIAGFALPCYGCVQIKGAQTKALMNAKQIATALRLYAADHNGAFPSYQLVAGVPADPPVPVTSSNDALCQVIPGYIPTEDIFWLAKSKWCTGNGPDDQIDSPMISPSNKTLASGENEWAYVPQLKDSSAPALPLLADGWITGGERGSHTYTADQTQKGGVWKGKQAVIVHVDTSAVVTKVDQRTMNVQGYNGGTVPGDIFSTAKGSNGWLKANNIAVNPK